jgi:thiol:disulfide interchange protein
MYNRYSDADAAYSMIAGMISVGSMFLFTIPMLIVSYWLYYRIIKKAGYPGAWVLILFAPTVVAVIGGIVAVVVASQSRGSGQVAIGLVTVAYVLVSLGVVVMFYVFAFSNWPILRKIAAHKVLQASAPPNNLQG